MIATWKQNLKKLSSREYKFLLEMAHLSKNVYNESLYNIRQHYFSEGSYLKYEANYPLMKTSENYKLLGVQVAQQTMKCVDWAFRSFFGLLKLVKNKQFSKDQVRIPHYLPKDGVYAIHVPELFIKNKCFLVPASPALKKKHNGPVYIRIPDKLLNKKIRQVHIIPKYDGKYFEACYIFDDDTDYSASSRNLDSTKALSIDLGINNFATCATSEGDSFIIDGRKIKSINQWYNKENARLSSIKDHQHIKIYTRKQYQLAAKRNRRIQNFIYCASKHIIQHCLANQIGNIVIGYNEGFQNSVNLGKINNQNFVMLPFGKFKSRLELLCERYGVHFHLQEESYTSKASFFDNDEMPVWNARNPEQGQFSGKRINRGLYKKSNGQVLNADINGALNILRKSKLTDLKVLQSRGYVVEPLRIRIN